MDESRARGLKKELAGLPTTDKRAVAATNCDIFSTQFFNLPDNKHQCIGNTDF